MDRRQFLVGSIALAASGTVAHSARVTEAARPNILLIMVDDMGFSDIGCYGSEIATPHLDRLAANGLRFTQFYNTGRCCPTRASLLTGLYPHQAGVGHMNSDRGLDGYRGDLNGRCVTIAEALKPAGYATYMVGKWHVTRYGAPKNMEERHNWPIQRGFDRFYGTPAGARNFWKPVGLTLDNMPLRDPLPEDYYYTDAITENMAQFLREHHATRPDAPFFAYFAHTSPHWPLHAHQADIDRYRGKYLDGWDKIRERRFAKQQELGLATAAWKLSQRHPEYPAWDTLDAEQRDESDLIMAIYAAMVTSMDKSVGEMVKVLEETGRLENTLILFLSDNGGCAEGGILGGLNLEHAEARPGGSECDPRLGGAWANANNTPFRWFKHYVHEGGSASPLVVHWPARIQGEARGTFRHQQGHVIDLMATCLEVAGAEYPTQRQGQDLTPTEGRSLVPAFDNQPIARDDALYWEHEGNCAIREGDWKLASLDRGKTWELYNIATDRAELEDLASQQPERVQQLAARWRTWAERIGVIPWPGSG